MCIRDRVSEVIGQQVRDNKPPGLIPQWWFLVAWLTLPPRRAAKKTLSAFPTDVRNCSRSSRRKRFRWAELVSQLKQRCLQPCRAYQVPVQLPDPSPKISSNASVALTLHRPRPESFLCFDSYSASSYNVVMSCCSRTMLLNTAAVDQHTDQHEFLSLLL